jgi:aspartate aminotransferase
MTDKVGTVPLLNEKTVSLAARGSPIRLMFETGNRLAKIHGRENVFDFSLGNPALEPPAEFTAALARLATNPPPGMHGYPPNRGVMACIEACAKRVSTMHPPVVVPPDCVCVTCGAAGAMNIFFHTICSPNEEILVFAPFFCQFPPIFLF